MVKDPAGEVLQGARIEMQPQLRPVTTNGQGEFTVTDVPAGTYAVTVSYVGFSPYTTSITVVPGQNASISARLQVASAADEVEVTADRPRGEAEAINRTLAAENILQVLPADVIVSLPNANIADALGRMPSVTIERDEGEGKYVQIRGTEPRLSNTMVDGVTIPSPESGVRQIKLDTIASDLVDSVEINKTLQANIDADGIGGSVNLVTKTASDTPTIVLYGVGGYTPIIGGRAVDQIGGTIGKRFGESKKLGVLHRRHLRLQRPRHQRHRAVADGGQRDARTTTASIFATTSTTAPAGARPPAADYKLSDGSNISLRGLFSTFRNWGNKWVYYAERWRRSAIQPGLASPEHGDRQPRLQGKHIFNSNTFIWNVAVGRSRSLGGSGSASFNGSAIPTSTASTIRASRPASIAPDGALAASAPVPTMLTIAHNYKLKSWAPPTFGQSVQLNLEAGGSYARLYHFGTRFGTFEFGGKIRNAHKFDDTYDECFKPNSSLPVAAHPEWNCTFTDPEYYDKTYHIGPVTD